MVAFKEVEKTLKFSAKEKNYCRQKYSNISYFIEMNGKIYINIDFKEYEYFLPRVISCTSYFSHFSPPTFFPLLSQFYSRCFLSPSSATAFRAYLRATHLLEFLSGNFTGTSRLPRSLLFYPSFSLKKKKKKKKKISTSPFPCTSSDPTGRFAATTTCSFYPFFYWITRME